MSVSGRRKVSMSAEQTARYRARYPERIKEYKSRPSTKARAAEMMRLRRARRTEAQKLRDKTVMRKYQLRKLYGLTEEAFEALQIAQNGLCAICQKPQCNNRWRIAKLYIDHDKQTGQRRGLLCSKCNLAIGGLQHSKELLLAAIRYLETYNVRVWP